MFDEAAKKEAIVGSGMPGVPQSAIIMISALPSYGGSFGVQENVPYLLYEPKLSLSRQLQTSKIAKKFQTELMQ